MTTLDVTGIKQDSANAVIAKLNELLADFQVFYTNMRGFHWNIKGSSFFTLHAKFEEQYDNLAEKVDEIAERILMLGGTPANKFSDYLKTSAIKEVSDISCSEKAVNNILETYKVIIAKEREIMDLAGSKGDEATNALMSDYIREQEKTVWMLVSYLTSTCNK